jgi:6-phosphogluconolactonase (cycloisomerase 2 family)
MKFTKFGPARTIAAAVFSLGAAAALTACGPNGYNNTVDYVYVTNSKTSPGQINVYYTDARSGALTQVTGSPFSSGGSNPVGLVTSPDFKFLYVIDKGQGGAADSGVVEFSIGDSAALSAKNTYAPPASLTEPNSIAINTAGTYLFVTYAYQPGYSAAQPGPGALVVYPINSDGSLGSPVANGGLAYYPLSTGSGVLNPTAVNVLTQYPVNATSPGPTFVYVVSQNTTTGLGDISAFSLGSGGALTYVPCSSSASICDSTGNGTFNAGTAPNAVASTPRGLFLYVTDSVNNQLISYTVQSSGQIVPNTDGPTRTDVYPDSVTVDPRGMYVYVANYTANDVSAYTINVATGYPTGVAAAGAYATGTGPTCVFVEPALGRYVYTTNFLDNTVSGLNLNPNTGTLAAVQNSPFIASGQPTCVTATPHGNYPLSTPVT